MSCGSCKNAAGQLLFIIQFMDESSQVPSRSQIKKSGRIIRKNLGTPEDQSRARKVIGDFRSAHAYPLNGIVMHVQNKVKDVAPQAVIARRLKRLPTILDKLERHPAMDASRMQDLGGCRVIVPSVGEVYRILDELKSAHRARNKIVEVTDYLGEHPKQDGYRRGTRRLLLRCHQRRVSRS